MRGMAREQHSFVTFRLGQVGVETRIPVLHGPVLGGGRPLASMPGRHRLWYWFRARSLPAVPVDANPQTKAEATQHVAPADGQAAPKGEGE
jgi:hypothetical protein